jgi:hypothetical protein
MLTAPSVQDEEIKALESRPRQRGWTATVSPERLATKKRRPIRAGELAHPNACEFCKKVACR